MARRTLSLALASALVAGLGLAVPAQAQEQATEQLPSYAQQEWEAAESAGAQGDPYGQAQQIPPPPNGVSSPQPVPESSRDRGDVEFEDFYRGLASHGTWVETPEYGYVFLPHRQTQVQDWRPYVYGRWVWTDYGWTWVSEEPFGWATYHYGRWTFLSGFGWAWVPGYTWGPAWVAWRYGSGAVGWAPLYPGYVSYTASYPFYHSHWVFIGPRHFYAHPVHHHHHPFHRTRHYYRETRRASHWYAGSGGRSGYVYAGPPRTYVERRGNARVRPTALRSAPRPEVGRIDVRAGQPPREVSVYRPDVAKVRADAVPPRALNRNVQVPRNVRAPAKVGSGLAPRQLEPARPADPSRIRTPGTARQAPGQIAPRPRGVEPRSATPPGQVEPRGVNPRAADPRRAEPRAVTPPPRISEPRRAEPRGVTPPRQVEPRAVNPRAAEPRRVEPRTVTPPPRASEPRRVEPKRESPRKRVAPPPRAQPRQRKPEAVRPERSRSELRRAAPRVIQPRSTPRVQPQRIAPQRSKPRTQAPRLAPKRAKPAPKRVAPAPRKSGSSRISPRSFRKQRSGGPAIRNRTAPRRR